MVFDVGGGKIQSSSNLIKQFKNYSERKDHGDILKILLEEKKL